MSLAFYFRYALRSLRRGGQRTLLAIVCIAFGVMSLVGLQSIAGIFSKLVVSEPRLEIGGDLGIWLPRRDATFQPDQLAALERFRQEGNLSTYTLLSYGNANFLKPGNSGHAYLLINRPLGIDPATYPLVGKLQLSNTDAPLTKVLAEPGSAVITRDLSEQLELKVGDSFSLSGTPGSAPKNFKVAAIATDTPRHFGGTVFYSLETARQLSGQANVVTQASALVGPKGSPYQQLESIGFDVESEADVSKINQGPAALFDFMFKGAGILGLLISGIGVANTLQVMLARRTVEIAVLKTLGYRQRDLLLLFGLETAMLGLAGSVMGAVAGTALSAALVGLFKHFLSLLTDWTIDPWLLLAGMLAGITTTLVFGTYSIVRTSGVRPAVVLRSLPTLKTWGSRFQALGLAVLLLAVFGIISSVILGSLLLGAGIIAIAVAGSIVLSLVFGAILFITVRVPTPRGQLVRMAQKNLKRQQWRAVFPLIALFAGVFTIGFSTLVITNAIDRFIKRGVATSGENLFIFAEAPAVGQITSELARQGLSSPQVRYALPVQTSQKNGGPIAELNVLQGRSFDSLPDDIEIEGTTWGARRDGVYVPSITATRLLTPGMVLSVLAPNGQTQDFPVLGTYKFKSGNNLPQQLILGQPNSLLVSQDAALKLGGSQIATTVISTAPTEQLSSLGDTLGKALPSTTVISLADVNDALQRVFKDLLTLAVTVAGLALVAGAVLIANSVGLAMVERRREVGILKAIGFSSNKVLGTIVLEQGLLGLIAGLLGMLGVVAAIVAINLLQPEAKLTFEILPAAGIMSAAIALAVFSALFVAWRPTHIRPLEVLRDE